MAKGDFIEKHWELAQAVDADMTRSTTICQRAFFNEDEATGTRLSLEDWKSCRDTLWYFIQLGIKYAYEAAGNRKLAKRPLIEAIFTYVILEVSLGEEVCLPLLEGAFTKSSLNILDPNLPHGVDRLQRNLESLRQTFALYQHLPRSLNELGSMKKSMIFEVQGLWRHSQAMKNWNETDRKAFARAILVEIQQVRKDWGILDTASSMAKTWIFADLNDTGSSLNPER